MISSFDCTVIPLKNIELFKGALPSKMFEAMSCQVPIVLSADGEARRLLEGAGGGICVEPERPGLMAQAILELYKNPSLSKAMGSSGRCFVERNYERKSIAIRLEKIIEGHIK